MKGTQTREPASEEGRSVRETSNRGDFARLAFLPAIGREAHGGEGKAVGLEFVREIGISGGKGPFSYIDWVKGGRPSQRRPEKSNQKTKR